MDFLDAGAVFPPDFIFDPAPAAQPAGTREAHQSLFESIVLNTSDVVLVGKIRQYDPFVCEVQYVNPAFERRSGRPLAELAGCPVEHLLGAETEDQAGHLRAAAFAQHSGGRSKPARHSTRNTGSCSAAAACATGWFGAW